MRTSASERLSQDQVMARLASTFSALIKEQIDAVERYLARSADDPDDGDIAGLVEPRSAWWSGARNGSAGEVASLALELARRCSSSGSFVPSSGRR